MDVVHAFVGWVFGIPPRVLQLDLHQHTRKTVGEWLYSFRRHASRYVQENNLLPTTRRAQVDETHINKWKRTNPGMAAVTGSYCPAIFYIATALQSISQASVLPGGGCLSRTDASVATRKHHMNHYQKLINH